MPLSETGEPQNIAAGHCHVWMVHHALMPLSAVMQLSLGSASNQVMMRLVRVVKSLRAIRMVRTLRLFRGLNLLVKACQCLDVQNEPVSLGLSSSITWLVMEKLRCFLPSLGWSMVLLVARNCIQICVVACKAWNSGAASGCSRLSFGHVLAFQHQERVPRFSACRRGLVHQTNNLPLLQSCAFERKMDAAGYKRAIPCCQTSYGLAQDQSFNHRNCWPFEERRRTHVCRFKLRCLNIRRPERCWLLRSSCETGQPNSQSASRSNPRFDTCAMSVHQATAR